MCTIVDFAKDQEQEAEMVGDQILITGFKYNYENLDRLSNQISMDKVFTRMDDNYVYFKSEFSPHSSFAKFNFTYMGKPHTSAEQAFLYQKAEGNYRPELAKTILETDDPRRCKVIAAGIKSGRTKKSLRIGRHNSN